jgi:hypothetical protein
MKCCHRRPYWISRWALRRAALLGQIRFSSQATHAGAVLMGRRAVQLLRELVPKCSRVALLWNPANPALFDFYQLRAAAAVLGLTLQPVVEVRHVTAVNGPTGRSGPSRCAKVRRRFA